MGSSGLVHEFHDAIRDPAFPSFLPLSLALRHLPYDCKIAATLQNITSVQVLVREKEQEELAKRSTLARLVSSSSKKRG